MKKQYFKIVFFSIALFIQIHAKSQKKYTLEGSINNSVSSNKISSFINSNRHVAFSLFNRNNLLLAFYESYVSIFTDGLIYNLETTTYTEDYYKYKIKNGKKEVGYMQTYGFSSPSDTTIGYNLFLQTSSLKLPKGTFEFSPLDEQIIMLQLKDTSHKELKDPIYLVTKSQFFQSISFYEASIFLLRKYLNNKDKKLISNSEVYLKIANLLWKLKKNDEAKLEYLNFIFLVKKKGKQINIPEYVKKRLKTVH